MAGAVTDCITADAAVGTVGADADVDEGTEDEDDEDDNDDEDDDDVAMVDNEDGILVSL